MPRAIDGTRRKEHRKKLHVLSKGFWGRRKNLFRFTKDAVEKSLLYAYRDRRAKKRDMRRLWIARISAIVRSEGLSYSKFIALLKAQNIMLNRKQLSNMAIENRKAFEMLIEKIKE